MAKESFWKEQLGFTSGVILLFGFVLVKLYAFASHIQLRNAGSGVRSVVGQDGKAIPEGFLFVLFACCVALGSTVLLFAFVHIALRGFWLASNDGEASSSQYVNKLDSICNTTFASVFWIVGFFVLSLPLYPFIMIVTFFQRLAVRLLSIQGQTQGVVLYVCVSLILLIPTYLIIIRVMKRYAPELLNRDSLLYKGSKLSAIVPFGIFGFIFLFLSYTAEIHIDKQIISRSGNEKLQASIFLGGKTSQWEKVQVNLLNDKGLNVQNVTFLELDKGHYTAHVYSSALASGRYDLVFRYDAIGVTTEYPFVVWEIRIVKPVVVVD